MELPLPTFIGGIETIIFTFVEVRPTRHLQAKLISKPHSADRVQIANRLAHNFLAALSFIFAVTFFRTADFVQRTHHLRG